MQEDTLLKYTITHGWPNTIREVPSKIQPFWTFQEELTVEDGIVLKDTCIVIPSKKCQSVLHPTHEGHLGVASTSLEQRYSVLARLE